MDSQSRPDPASIAASVASLPATGYLRAWQIIGRKAVDEREARANREADRKTAKRTSRATAKAVPGPKRRPKRARPAVPALLPISKSAWWAGVKSGRYPAPVKIGPGTTAWRVEDIRGLLERLGAVDSDAAQRREAGSACP